MTQEEINKYSGLSAIDYTYVTMLTADGLNPDDAFSVLEGVHEFEQQFVEPRENPINDAEQHINDKVPDLPERDIGYYDTYNFLRGTEIPMPDGGSMDADGGTSIESIAGDVFSDQWWRFNNPNSP